VDRTYRLRKHSSVATLSATEARVIECRVTVGAGRSPLTAISCSSRKVSVSMLYWFARFRYSTVQTLKV
jgi:hypothetical protein